MKKSVIYILLLKALFIPFSINVSFSQETNNQIFNSDSIFLNFSSHWVDSVFNSLSIDERIAQLLMVAAYSNQDQEHIDYISGLIKRYRIGGLIFFQGGPQRQAIQTNYYQSISKTPLLTAIDAEWGLGMRLDSTISYPRQMMLGAIRNNQLIYEMGEDIALQFKRMGIHINFAPVVDVNNNPNNPVINVRSFGEDKRNVADKGLAYMLGLQDNNILATAKHFPGHGDTDKDSHLTLPVIPHTVERLDSIELYPFRHLINKGLGGIMVAHLNIPALDTTKNQASTLSKKIVTGLLKEKLYFNGLVFTDALNMKAVSDYEKPGDLEVKALAAGNDLLLIPLDIPKTIIRIKREMKCGVISQEELERSCKKVLALKQWVGLNNYQPVKLDNLYENLNSPEFKLHKRKLVEASLTLLENKNDIIPCIRLDTLKIASVAIGTSKINAFQETLSLYAEVKHFNIKKEGDTAEFNALIDSLANYNLVIVGNHNTSNRPSQNFGISKQAAGFINRLSTKIKVILDVFAIPYSLTKFNNLQGLEALIMSYEDTELSQSLSAQLIFGGVPVSGKLPVSPSKEYPVSSGIVIEKSIRLKYSIPEEAGMDLFKLEKIDSLVMNAIEERAVPGCQVLAARNGVVFYNKSYGYHTYMQKIPVKNYDIYDLASITKIAATLPSLMRLTEEGLFNIDSTLSFYLPYLDTTNKKDLVIKDILTHQARLQPWIPFYLFTIEGYFPDDELFSNVLSSEYPFKCADNLYFIKNFKIKENFCSNTYSDIYPIQIADHFYLNRTFKDSIYNRITRSELREKKEYNYSDLGYYYFYRIIENIANTSFYQYIYNNLYHPLGAGSMGFLPLNRFDKSRIIPMENDLIFRKQLIHGYVHDPGTAMLGGICGHAGLFSNANDLAKLMQMYLQKGEYGGIRYLKKETIEYFTSCPYCEEGNRRGIGFDKPEMDYSKNGPTCQGVSGKSFGHPGFTGCIAWADPEEQIVYIFLSNRIHPNQNNTKLIDMNVRPNIQKAIYDAIKTDE